MECAWQVEIDEYATKILERHWPYVQRWRDVRTFPPEVSTEWCADIIVGGFPCQDISAASKSKTGLNGERSGLWGEFFRIICELRPKYVVVENSAMLLSNGFDVLLGQLAGCGYDAEWQVLRAYEFGAPHERERLYIVAYPNGIDGPAGLGLEPNGPPAIFDSYRATCVEFWLQAPDRFVGVVDGLSPGSYRNRGRCIGNAVVPQIAEWIGRRIMNREAEREMEKFGDSEK